jgi:hypothetical protein
VEAATDRLDDLQALMRASGEDADGDADGDIRDLERQFTELMREREQLRRAIRGPAEVAGGRRS